MHPSTSRRSWRGARTPVRLLLLGFLICGFLANLFVPARNVGAATPGAVLAFGDNRSSQLGLTATGAQRANPGSVSTATDGGIVAVAAGQNFSLALRQDGTVLTWGSNFPSGQVGQNTTQDRLDPAPVVGLSGATAIAGGYVHALAVAGGAVYAWGDNNYGQLGTATTTNCNGGPCSRVAIPVGLSNAASVGAGARHSLAVMTDGTVRAWGLNSAGGLGDGSTTQRPTPVAVLNLTGVTGVAGGEGHSLAVKSDGTVWAWGQNQQGQLGLGTVDVTAHPTPAQVPGLSGVVAVAAGYRFSLALKADGTVWAWGENGSGQVGNGSISTNACACTNTPTQVGGVAGAVAIEAGADFALAAQGDGAVMGWGDNGSYQLGITTPAKVATATAALGLTGAKMVAAGGGHSLALRAVPQFALYVSNDGSGSGTVTPGAGNYDAGSQVVLTAQANADSVFTGWTLDGAAAGGRPTLTVTMDKSHTVVATFSKPLAFCDVTPTDRYFEAIRQLSARGIIRGFEATDGRLCFAPDSGTKRAQMAALIARPLGWDQEDHGNGFSDRNGVDDNLWRNVGTLFFYEVAKGYKPETCQALGVGTPCYGPTDEVVHAQVISFITRGMVKKGYWTFQPDNAALYPNIPASSGHREDIATYLHYVGGTLPGTASTTQGWNDWDQPAQRDWFAESLWRALNSYFGFR